MHDPDRRLLKRIAEGNTQALERLYQRFGLRLLNFLLQQLNDRQTAEEVLQTTMLIAWKSAPDFRGESEVSTGLFGIARHQASKVRRTERNHLPLHESLLGSRDDHPDPILVNAMRAAITKLTPLEQQAR